MLAELLIRMVQATAAGLTIQPLSSRDAAGLQGERQQEEQLLPPMTPDNYETNYFLHGGNDIGDIYDRRRRATISKSPDLAFTKSLHQYMFQN